MTGWQEPCVCNRVKAKERDGSSKEGRTGDMCEGVAVVVLVAGGGGIARQVTDGVYLCPAEIMGSPGRHKSFILSYFLAAMNNGSGVGVTRSHDWNLPGPLLVESGPNGVCFDGQYFTPYPPLHPLHIRHPQNLSTAIQIPRNFGNNNSSSLALLTITSLTHRKPGYWECCCLVNVANPVHIFSRMFFFFVCFLLATWRDA